jgi:opacity protein-like surface antigen
MKSLLGGGALIAGLALAVGTAMAADVSTDGASRWDGGNFGLYGSFSAIDAEYSDPYNEHIGNRMNDEDSNQFNGYGGGLRAGYNFVNGSVLLGAEAYGELQDAQACVNTNEANQNPTSCPYGHSVETEVSQSFGLNAKLGVATDTMVIYGLAGVNVAKVKSTFNDWTFDDGEGEGNSVYDPEFDTIDSGSEYVAGWRVGGGAELSVSEEMSLFAQATYTRLNTEVETPNLNALEEFDSRLDTKLGIIAVNLGLNFSF